jgi:hypothetical protein
MVDVAFIIGGLIAIAIAIWGKKFGEADVEGFPTGRSSSTWSGKVVFGVVGVGFVILGILRLLGHD